MRHKFFWQCAAVALLAFISDIVAAVHIRAFIAGNVAVSVGSIMLAHYLAFCAQAWFIEHHKTSQRLCITTAAAIGAGVGSAVILLL